MHYDLKDILYHWQNDFCAGHYMPDSFREKASAAFSEAFLECDGLTGYEKLYKTNKTIYRVHSLNYVDEPIINFDNLYYSFSNDIVGLTKVVEFNKNLKYYLIIIEAMPLGCLNMNELHKEIYGFDSPKFANENEILSKFSKSTIKNVYYLENGQDIANYKRKGIKIDLEDVNLSYGELVKKYNIDGCV